MQQHTQNEEWRPVRGYEGSYLVSNQGRVRSVSRVVPRGSNSITVPERELTAHPNRSGRLRVNLSRNNVGKHHQVHVLVLEAFVGQRPAGMVCCHNNGNHTDNRLENLRWDTPSANEYDKQRHGTDHNVNKTHCPYGHAMEGLNLKRAASGRGCKACNRAYAKRCLDPKIDVRDYADVQYERIMRGAGRLPRS